MTPDGKNIVSVSRDGGVCVWDATGECQTKFWKKGSDIAAAVSSDGETVVAGVVANPVLRVFDVQTGVLKNTLHGHTELIRSVDVSPSGDRIASASWDKTVRVWNAETGLCENVLSGHARVVTCVLFSPDGAKIVSGSQDKTVRVWNAQTGACEKILKGCTYEVFAVAMSRDQTMIAAGLSDSNVCLWDAVTGTLLRAWSVDTN